MVMERISACPINQTNVWIGAPLTVVIVAAARVEQAVGNTRCRNRAAERVPQRLHRRRAESEGCLGDACGRTIAETEAPARQTDLAQRRGQQDDGPIGLLAVIGTLERPGSAHHCAARRHAPSERADSFSRNAGDD
jgi:hypothetical protein